MNKNYYDILWVSKSASDEEIKRAYKKLAMRHHPDRTKWDKKAEDKFKEANEAYQTLGDKKKRANYDQFWSAEGSPFSGMGWNPFGSGQSGWSAGGLWGFEDIFSTFWWGNRGKSSSQGFEFDIGDLFGNTGWGRRTENQQSHQTDEKKEENLTVTETVEIPFFDFLFDTSISVRTVYGKNLTLKVKAGTKPGTRFKISGKWRTTGGKTGDMYVIVEAKMPKTPLDSTVEKMIEAIRYQV